MQVKNYQQKGTVAKLINMHFATAPFFDDNLVDVLLTPYISVIMKTFKKIEKVFIITENFC